MKSKRKIIKQKEKKTNFLLVKTIKLAIKNKDWIEIAGILSQPRRKKVNMNLGEIDKETKEKESVLVPGKILSQGEIKKKFKIVALNFSEKAIDKLKRAGCEVSNILEEIKKNPGMENIRVLKNNKK